MRAPNAIDFWRGFALFNIFLSHMPGNAFERLSHRHYSLADAELFVFLAGWSLRLAHRSDTTTLGDLARHALLRVAKLYKVQIATTVVALLIMALASRLLGDHALLRWGNAGAVFDDPVHGWLGLAILTHQLQYFDIMPLYIVLGVWGPLMIVLDRRSPWLLLACSTTLWALAGVTRMNLPTWPVAGGWFFNPLAWQLSFTLGFVLAGTGAPARLARASAPLLFWPALVIALVGSIAVAFRCTPDATRVDFTLASLLFSKSFIGPARLIHFFAMLIICGGIFPFISRKAAPIASLTSLLGRHSLPVFTAASLLSLLGRVAQHAGGKGLLSAFMMVAFGATILLLTARICEWRRYQRRRSYSPLLPQQPAST